MVDTKAAIKASEVKMQGAIEHLEDVLARIRAGKANPRILDGVMVEYYGSMTPLSGVANITTPDARTIIVQPWEKPMLKEIERALLNSEVGITPENNGEVIRLGIPPLTEERRKQLVKQVKQEVEDAKISIRNARRDGNEAAKKLQKDGELTEDELKKLLDDIQKATDKHIADIDKIVSDKEKELLTV